MGWAPWCLWLGKSNLTWVTPNMVLLIIILLLNILLFYVILGTPCSILGLQILGSQQATRSLDPGYRFHVHLCPEPSKISQSWINIQLPWTWWKCVASVFLVTFWMKKNHPFWLAIGPIGLALGDWPFRLWEKAPAAGHRPDLDGFDDFSPENERSNPPLVHRGSILRFWYQKVGVSPWTSCWTLLRGSRFSKGTALELNLPLGKERGLELTWFNVPSNPLWD